MKQNTKSTTTSLTVDPEVLLLCKQKLKGYKMNTSELLHRTMKLFLDDEEYRTKILNTKS